MVDASQEKPRRWLRLTPERCVLLVLLLEGFLILSELFQWFAFDRLKGRTMLLGMASVGLSIILMFLWFLAAVLFRLRFQFTIRSLLLLTLVVAIPCSWLAVARQEARRQREAVAEIERAGGRVYAWPEPAWLRELLVDDLFTNVTEVDFANSEIGDAGLEHLKGLPQLQVLYLTDTKVSDAGMEHVKQLPQLQVLGLGGTRITDAGLEHLKGVAQLGWLDLRGTKVSDAGLEHLKGLTKIFSLNLRGTAVGDAGLEHLKGMATISGLDLSSTAQDYGHLQRTRFFR
ncbi:MAG: leucine-rich repeat domain-containing protein [Thermoguttaceae bacterium]